MIASEREEVDVGEVDVTARVGPLERGEHLAAKESAQLP